MNKAWVIILGGMWLGGVNLAAASACNRNEVCPPICVEDESETCTRITNDSQRCALRKYTCEGCITATARSLELPVACVACVMDVQAAKVRKGVKRIPPETGCQAVCGSADTVKTVIKNNRC